MQNERARVDEAMKVYKAHVENGEIVLDEPAELPEGAKVIVEVVNPEVMMTPEERAQLDADIEQGLADCDAGRGVDHTVLREKLRARRQARVLAKG